MKRAKICHLILILFLAGILPAELINQDKVGKNTCGTCAFVHSLSLIKNSKLLDGLKGNDYVEKAKHFLEKYGSVQSGKYKNRAVYREKDGICDTDLLMIVNRFMKSTGSDEVKGSLVLRGEQESPENFVKRFNALLKKSIEKGFYPIVSVRALAAEYSEKSKKYLWNNKGGHWVTVSKVGALSPDNLGFTFNFLDSISGRELQGYCSVNLHRKAVVNISFEVDENNKEKWQWVSNSRTLELYSPGMPIGTGCKESSKM